jgi:hypothetical protein
VLAAALAELRELQTASGRSFVLRRRVIALLALGALQRDDFAHRSTPKPFKFATPAFVVAPENQFQKYISAAAGEGAAGPLGRDVRG